MCARLRRLKEPNIGLINSLAVYARTNAYGFSKRRIVASKRQGDYGYRLSVCIEESQYMVAQANADMDKNGKFLEDFVAVRYKNETTLAAPEDISYMDVRSATDRFGCRGSDSIPRAR